MKAPSKSLVVDTLSKLYALGIVVLGILLSTSKVVPGGASVKIINISIEVFRIFLTGVAVLFFLFMLIFLVRRVSLFEESELQGLDERVQEQRGMSRAQSFNSLATTFIFEVTPPSEANSENSQQLGNQSVDGVSLPQESCRAGRSGSTLDLPPAHQNGGSRLTRRTVSVVEYPSDVRRHRAGTGSSKETVAPVTILRHGEAAYPNFYVRLGAVFFGIGTILSTCIGIIFYGDVIVKCHMPPLMFVFRWALQAVFAALQLHFIFRYSKISINRFKGLCQFGVMHLLATNVNSWIFNVMDEVSEIMNEHTHGQSPTTSTSFALPTNNGTIATMPGILQLNGYGPRVNTKSCSEAIIRATDVVSSYIYLYPLIVEFSLICAVSFNNIYSNIGITEKIRLRRRIMSKANSSDPSTIPQFPNHLKFDITCHKSYKGTFFGIIMATTSVLSCVVSNAYEKTDVKVSGAIFNFTDIVLLFFSIIAVCSALYMIKQLSILPSYRRGPDENLLMIAVVGVYSSESFTIYSYLTTNELEVWMRVAGAFAGCLSLLQATLQVLFVYDGLRRHSVTSNNLRHKPGREAVVLLLLLNLSLWLQNLLNIRGGVYQVMGSTNPQKLHEWNVMATFCKPLSIFFRFHSSTCLYEIWKNSYTFHESVDD
ncbi:proton channel OtopLc-like [Lineus longissimus]|uniref:proton channel OtopLc-like n=1 Tax=Lineus longissimus TaxID=88925 RepID=UPI002B4E6518